MFKPEFEIRHEGHSIAKYIGPKDDSSLLQLISLFRREKWRGGLVINYPGNGGVQDVTFTEKKPAKIISQDTA